MKATIPLPESGKMTGGQVQRYRALLAFQLRAANMEHADIGRVLNISTPRAKRYVKFGRRTMEDCILGTVPD